MPLSSSPCLWLFLGITAGAILYLDWRASNKIIWSPSTEVFVSILCVALSAALFFAHLFKPSTQLNVQLATGAVFAAGAVFHLLIGVLPVHLQQHPC